MITKTKITAEEYCTADKHYICSFSGGKDSVATYLYLTKELGFKNVTALFADTGWESEITYQYIKDLKAKGWNIITVSGSTLQLDKTGKKGLEREPLTMQRLVKIKNTFPATLSRFCTTELKLIPMQNALSQMLTGESEDFFYWGELPDLQGKDVVVVTGTRAEESPKRAKMDDFIFDEFTGCHKWHAIHKWKVREVFAISMKYGIKVNPLYKKGSMRVGCYPCIMTNKEELNAIARHDPEMFDKVREVEIELDKSFWHADTTSKKYRSAEITKKDGKKHRVATAHDVRDWALGVQPLADGQELLFADFDETLNIDAPVCESAYGLCEVAMKETPQL